MALELRHGMVSARPSVMFGGRQGRLSRLIWPAGIPASESAILRSLSNDQRESILDRLEAVWRADQGEPLGPLAELAGLKRAAFFNLRRAWRKYSLAGLIPHELRKGRRVVTTESDPRRVQARELLRKMPQGRNVDIAKEMVDPELAKRDRNSYLTKLQSAERIVQHERRSLVTDPSFLQGAYGLGLVIDMMAISLVLDEEPRSLAVVGLVVEAASGLVLGSSLGRYDEGALLQLKALSRALDYLRRRRADRDLAPSEKLDVTLVLPSSIDADFVEEELKPYVGNMVVGKVGGFSFGSQAVQIVGPRIGRMVLNPRRTLAFDVDAFLAKRKAAVHSIHTAEAIWAREVERHNTDRVKALRSAGLVDGEGMAEGSMAAIIRVLVEAIEDQPEA